MPKSSSDLEILSEMLSFYKNSLLSQSHLTDCDKKVMKSEIKKIKYTIALIKHPGKRVTEEFEERISIGFFTPPELSERYFNFLWPYLLCCFFSVKYKVEFGYSFPPSDKGFSVFAKMIIDSYVNNSSHNSKEAYNLYIFDKQYPMKVNFLFDLKKSFNNIALGKMESFLILSMHCRYMCLVFFWLSEIKDVLENLDDQRFETHPLQESVQKLKKQKIGFTELKDHVDGWALSLSFEVWKLIGYWKHEFERIQKSKKGMNNKKEKLQTLIMDLFLRIKQPNELSLNNIAGMISEGLEKKGQKRGKSPSTIKRYLKKMNQV